MWVKRSGIVYVTLVCTIIALIFRVYYVSFSDIQNKVKAVAGGRNATLNLYNTKGIIYDRELIPLAGNQFIYYLVINPRAFDRQNAETFCKITSCDEYEFNQKLNKESVFVIESFVLPEEMPGVYVYDGVTRYPEKSVCQHIIGYLDNDGVVGLSGAEKAFNDELSASLTSTSISYSTNAVRGVISGLGIAAKTSGEQTQDGIILTLDKNLSLYAETVMDKYMKDGAVVVMDCNNGELLSVCSSPDFDYASIDKYMSSENGELINNALVTQTAGSVFKMVTAACALTNGYEDFTFDCSGGIEVGGRIFRCQNKDGHGHLDLESAFSLSCNSYFIALGQLLGYDKLIETAQLFGVDSKINLCKNMFSSSGKLPSESNSRALANLSIGQGELMITPLEIARITAVMCNGGYLVNPELYYGTYFDGEVSNKSCYEYKSQIINSEIAEKLKQMCIKCVSEGTGKNALPRTGGAGGKTASAQTGIYDSNGDEILNTYFTGFYPASDPKYVITVFAKNGSSGASTCAPVFREICEFISENY